MRKQKFKMALLLTMFAMTMSACSQTNNKTESEHKPLNSEIKEATEHTSNVNSEIYKLLDFSDKQEQDFAQKELITAPESLEIKSENGNLVWSQNIYKFVQDKDAPDSSLSLEEQIASGKTLLIVPEGFETAAIEENAFAGNAMKRRLNFQYGSLLEKGETGSLSVGIGLTTSNGTTAYMSPTFEVTDDLFETTVDGVKMIFQLTPGTESPAEMNTYLPEYKALWMAENCTGTMHNIYTLRGAEIRDANAWARYIMEAKDLFGDDAEVILQSHNWPHWGKEVINEYLLNTTAVYKFIHTQTLQYINEGYTETEIAHKIELPDDLEKVWYTRQYYGTLKHNVKAVYQK